MTLEQKVHHINETNRFLHAAQIVYNEILDDLVGKKAFTADGLKTQLLKNRVRDGLAKHSFPSSHEFNHDYDLSFALHTYSVAVHGTGVYLKVSVRCQDIITHGCFYEDQHVALASVDRDKRQYIDTSYSAQRPAEPKRFDPEKERQFRDRYFQHEAEMKYLLENMATKPENIYS